MSNKLQKVIFDFTSDSTAQSWNSINDGVMGGVSQSSFRINPDSTATFSGRVSLENNGGFASARTFPQDLQLGGFTGIVLRIKGDGHTYSFRLRTGEYVDGISYQAKFVTEKDRWIEVCLPFEIFVPTFRGRALDNLAPLQPEKIQQIGFLIGDKQEGPFELNIDWIKTFHSSSTSKPMNI